MPTKAEAYALIQELVAKFESNLALYTDPAYNETETRNEFITPFWRALGWDIENQEGYAPLYKEVQVEQTIKVYGTNKRPDYSFFHATRQQTFFYIEAKKPSIKLQTHLPSLKQARHYGWSAKMKIAIATNFGEFVICNCTTKVRKNTTPKALTYQYFTYQDYLTKFDFFWNTFGRESVYTDSLYAYTLPIPDIDPKESVDNTFLRSLEKWRKHLAPHIAQKNKHLEDFELNFVVQLLIDRLVFLKVAEDRRIEPDNQLLEIGRKGNMYEHLLELFVQADERYNSGLFNLKKDRFSPTLKVNTKLLQDIIEELYHGDDEDDLLAYRFDIMPVEILGYAYEHFLGNVIILDSAGVANIEQKLEVRKAGGVYYTPVEVVNYIVAHTIGTQIAHIEARAGKDITAEEVAELKILDPSCGSGSFLLGAYNYLLQWHLNYYLQMQARVGKPLSKFLTPDNQLTTLVKKQVLRNNIFGVDIDEQAVEVTKLSLLIRCMEGETNASIKTHQILHKERALPDLDTNVLCGNSLISHSFYNGKLFPTPKEMRKVNTFEWQDGFTSVLKNRGFDIIIGNPPYVSSKEIPEVQKIFFRENYQTAQNQFDLYTLFIEKSLQLLKNDTSFFAMIIPDALLDRSSAESIRKYILKNSSILELTQVNGVFSQASVASLIIRLHKFKDNKNIIRFNKFKNMSNFEIGNATYKDIDQKLYEKIKNNSFLFVSEEEYKIIEKIKQSKTLLSEISFMGRGEELGKDSDVILHKNLKDTKDFLAGEDVGRYTTDYGNKYIKIKNIQKDLKLYAKKIVVRQLGETINASYDDKEAITNQSVYTIIPHSKYEPYYILAILNSKMMSFIYQKLYKSKDLFPRILLESLKELPIAELDLKDKKQKKQHDLLLEYVEKMFVLYKNLRKSILPTDKAMYERMIRSMDKQINDLIYEIYQLIPQEIDIIESV